MSKGDKITILGRTFKVHMTEQGRDVVWIYGWRDVKAQPVTRTWIAAAPA